ncbi:hypothetical protein [Pseudomonas fluorescens]|uniref:hypothetical protein n=1 Tax=Pseudomonas fluorescens TaxID=294 RepID=UPI00380CF093
MSRTFFNALGIIGRKDNLLWEYPSPFLPLFQFHERHESGPIRAQPEAIIAAVCALNMRDDRVVDALLSLRELPGKILRTFGDRTVPQEPAPFGFDAFTLLERTSTEVSLGLAGRFWRPDLKTGHIADAQAFKVLDDPHVAKLLLRFQVVEHPQGMRTLRTETFVYCATTRSKMLFTPYWLLIRLASGWIRRRNLAAIQRQFSTERVV